MNKKGFTLIEIIVCLVLITLIATISVISINNSNKKQKEEEKLIVTVTNAANVYYSMNNELKQKLKNNYGYLVVSIDELKENGYLDKNYIVPTSNDKDYSKMVIVEDDISNKYRLLSNEESDNLGYIDYIYPYVENDPFIINLEDLIIESFEINNLKCNSGLDDSKLSYLDKDYTVQQVDIEEDDCKYHMYDKDNFTIGNNINKSSLTAGNMYKIKYTINNIEGYRNLEINKEPNFKLKINDEFYDSNKKYYFNNNVTLSIEDTENGTHELYTKSDDNSDFEKNTEYVLKNEENILIKTYNGTITYKIKGKLSDTDSEETTVSYNNITIDKENPYIEKINYDDKTITINDKGSGIKSYKIDNNSENKVDKGPNNQVDIIPEKDSFKLTMTDNAGNKVTKNISLINPININVTKNNDISTFNVIVESSMSNVKINSVQVQYSFDKEFLKDMKRYGYVKKDIKSEMKKTMLDVCSTEVRESHSERYYCNGFANNFLYENDYSTRQEDIKDDSYKDNNTKFNQTFDMKTALSNCNSSGFCKKYISFEDDLLNGLEINYHIKVNYNNNGIEETQEKEYTIKLNINKTYRLGEDNDSGRYFHLEGINNNGDLLFYASVYNSGTTKYEFSLYNNKENQIKDITNLNDYSRWGRYWDSNVSVISYDNNEIKLYSCTTKKHGTKNAWFNGTNYFYTYNIQNSSLTTTEISTKWKSKCDSYYPTGDNMENNFIRLRNDSDYEFLNWLITLSQGRYGWDYSNTNNFSKFNLYNEFDRVIPSYDKKSKNIIIRERYEGDDLYHLLNYKPGVTINEVK